MNLIMLDQSSDIKHCIFTEIRKKIGNVHIHLELTFNNKARLTIASHRVVKDFVNQRDALQWLIYTYNLKHLKNILVNCRPQEVLVNDGVKKRYVINDIARELTDMIAEQQYYSTELFRNVVNEFDKQKFENSLSDDELGNIYNMVMESIKSLLDETLDHRRYDTYKKYFDQLRIKGYRKF